MKRVQGSRPACRDRKDAIAGATRVIDSAISAAEVRLKKGRTEAAAIALDFARVGLVHLKKLIDRLPDK